MISEELHIVLEEFEKQLTVAAQQVLIKHGVERTSDLIKNMKYEYEESNDMFKLIAYDYYVYLSTGRRRGAKKVPIEDLLKWIKDKGIVTQNINSTAFAIQRAIYKNGIKPKKYQDPVVDVSTELLSEYAAEELSEIIVNEIVDAIEN